MVDFELAFTRALLLVGNTAQVRVTLKKSAGYTARASLNANTLTVRVSDAFNSAPQEVIDGMAFSMTFRMFKRKPPAVVQKQIDLYKEFMSRETVSKHNETLRAQRGRKRKIREGTFFNLSEVLRELSVKYWAVFEPINVLPSVSFAPAASKRRLGYFDSAHNMILVSSIFDDARVPRYVVEAVVFHELLHAKHDVLFQRGVSMRRTVHTQAFKLDEKKYEFYKESEEWIKTKLRHIR